MAVQPCPTIRILWFKPNWSICNMYQSEDWHKRSKSLMHQYFVGLNVCREMHIESKRGRCTSLVDTVKDWWEMRAVCCIGHQSSMTIMYVVWYHYAVHGYYVQNERMATAWQGNSNHGWTEMTKKIHITSNSRKTPSENDIGDKKP